MKCAYGCGAEASHQFKNGKWCCSSASSSCPGMKKKNSNSNSKPLNIEYFQELYDSGLSVREISKIHGCQTSLFKLLKTRSRSDARKLVKPQKHTQLTKNKLSDIAKEKNLGGYVQGSGRGKKGWYKGFFCDSSWELAYVIYHIDHNINIVRNTEKFQYTYKDRVKNYIPDFIVNNEYIEIKGYDTDEWKAKLASFPHYIKVLYSVDMKFYIDYAINKYGKDFIKLYE